MCLQLKCYQRKTAVLAALMLLISWLVSCQYYFAKSSVCVRVKKCESDQQSKSLSAEIQVDVSRAGYICFWSDRSGKYVRVVDECCPEGHFIFQMTTNLTAIELLLETDRLLVLRPGERRVVMRMKSKGSDENASVGQSRSKNGMELVVLCTDVKQFSETLKTLRSRELTTILQNYCPCLPSDEKNVTE